MSLASEHSLGAVLQKIVELACEVSGAKYGALGVITPDGKALEDFFTHGITQEQRASIGRLPEGKGLLGALIQDAQPVRLTRIKDDRRSIGFPANHPPMTTFLGVPIAVRSRVFGNLYLTEKEGGVGFTADDELAVITLAAQAGVAIENVRLNERAATAQRRLEAVNEVARAILEGSEGDDVLSLIARRARELAGAYVATIATPEPQSGSLVLRVADGDVLGMNIGMHFSVRDSFSGEAMQHRRSVVVADASADSRTDQPLVARGDIGPAIFVPLAIRDRVFGSLAVGKRLGDLPFTEESLAVVETFAAQAAVSLDYSRLQHEIQRLIVIEDRERIAKELHDDIVQSLFAEGMSLQAAISMVHDPVVMEDRLTQAVENIDRVIRDLRNYIFGLKPGVFADRHLDSALRDLAQSFADGSVCEIDVRTEPEAVSHLAGMTTELIQVTREALSNAVRHSQGDHIQVRLRFEDAEPLLEVADNGIGFDPVAAAGKGHGLDNLRARAAALGGKLEIDSEPGRGTRVRIKLPS